MESLDVEHFLSEVSAVKKSSGNFAITSVPYQSDEHKKINF